MVQLCLKNNSSYQINSQQIVDAINKQIQQDFSPVWNINASISADPNCEGWNVLIEDNSDVPGAGGYHDVDGNFIPYAKVFINDLTNAGIPWTVGLSHEVLEMLADPFANLMVAVSPSYLFSKFYMQEVGDPVEDYYYTIGGIQVSDFVYPSYFIPNSGPPYDKLNIITQPLQVSPGGYQIVFISFIGSGLQEILGEKKKQKMCHKPIAVRAKKSLEKVLKEWLEKL